MLFLFCVSVLIAGIAASESLPAVYSVSKGSSLEIASDLPLTVDTGGTTGQVFSNNSGKTEYASLKLLGAIPIKDVSVSFVDPVYVVPGGNAFGIKIFTDGVMVVGITDVRTESGTDVCPASKAGLQKGDIILAVNDITVSSNSELSGIIANSGGNPLRISAWRGQSGFECEITPVKSSADDSYKAGIWVRDSSAGIGTLTFYNPENGVYAGLGHAVCDIDTGEKLPVLTGQIVKAGISGIDKGQKGKAGEVKGYFVEDRILGSLILNSDCGVYGVLSDDSSVVNQSVRVAMKQEVTTGEAQILSSVSGSPEYYDCEIIKVNLKDNSSLQNLVIKVTDDDLIALTGGIVQGMSGSPIFQNGTLVGAVTHVFLEDPMCGYGIFAETMLNMSDSVDEISAQKAS